MTCITNAKSSFEFQVSPRNPELSFPRSPEGAHAKVGEDERECGCQCDLPYPGRASLIAVILPHGRSAADHGEHDEQQTRDFQPKHVSDAADAAERDTPSPVERTHPAVFPALPPRNTKQSPALSTEIAGWHV